MYSEKLENEFICNKEIILMKAAYFFVLILPFLTSCKSAPHSIAHKYKIKATLIASKSVVKIGEKLCVTLKARGDGINFKRISLKEHPDYEIAIAGWKSGGGKKTSEGKSIPAGGDLKVPIYPLKAGTLVINRDSFKGIPEFVEVPGIKIKVDPDIVAIPDIQIIDKLKTNK